MRSGIHRFKEHVAGIRGNVRCCPTSTTEAKVKCKDAVEASKNNKKARQEEKQEVRNSVDIDGPSAAEDTSCGDGLDEIGSSAPKQFGPIDRFTLSMDPTKMTKQQKISTLVWKEKNHRFKRYVAKWVYVHGNLFIELCVLTLLFAEFYFSMFLTFSCFNFSNSIQCYQQCRV